MDLNKYIDEPVEKFVFTVIFGFIVSVLGNLLAGYILMLIEEKRNKKKENNNTTAVAHLGIF